MSSPRVIKRYANRKLYDTQDSRYVTLDQIASLIRQGEDVKIVDNKSKEDITSVTLAQILFEEEKKQKSFLPLAAMRNVIQTGGESLSNLVTQAQKKVSHILGRDNEAEGGEPNPDGTASTENPKKVSWNEMHEWLGNAKRSMDDWQKRMDDRIRGVVEGISPLTPLQKDVSQLNARIEELEAKLREALAEEAAGKQNQEASSAEAAPPGASPPPAGTEES